MEPVEKDLSRAKTTLMSRGHVFLTTICLNLKHIFSDEVPTAATNGEYIIYNPEYFASLTKEEKLFLLAHETWHVALNHMIRGKNKEKPALYNKAADYVINQLLVDYGFSLPDGGLLDNKYRGWSTDQVYKDLINSNQDDKHSDKDIIYIGSDINDKSEQEKEEEIKQQESKIKGILSKAKMQSQIKKEAPGKIPGEINRIIEELLNPIIPWNSVLERFMNSKSKDDYSWSKPNRKYFPQYYLPSTYSECMEEIVIAIDTSGSISNDEIKDFLSEIRYIFDTIKPKSTTILSCDYYIHEIHKLESDSKIEDLKISGGGGTRTSPVFNYCNNNPTTILVYFTDLYVDDLPNNAPEYEVIWVVHSNPEGNVPFGEIIHYERNNNVN